MKDKILRSCHRLVSLLAKFASDRDTHVSFGKSRGVFKHALRCVRSFLRRKDCSLDMFMHRKAGLMWCLSFVNDRETSIRVLALSIAQSMCILHDENDSSSPTLRRATYRVARLLAMDISESEQVRAAAFTTLASLTRRPVQVSGGIQRSDVSRAMTVCELIVLRSSSLLSSDSPSLVSSVAAALDSAMMIVPQDALRLLLKGDVFETTWHRLLSYLERRPSSNYFEDSNGSSSVEYLDSVRSVFLSTSSSFSPTQTQSGTTRTSSPETMSQCRQIRNRRHIKLQNKSSQRRTSRSCQNRHRTWFASRFKS